MYLLVRPLMKPNFNFGEGTLANSLANMVLSQYLLLL
jgi:hypothetical protein